MKWYEHGGKREGSGRKKKPKPEIVSLRLSSALKEEIEEEAELKGMSINKYIVELLLIRKQ